MAARNIAAHIERELMDKPRDWAPLLFCWRGGTTVRHWQELARAGQTSEVVRELLVKHYDPTYLASMQRNFALYPQARSVQARNHSHQAMSELAAQILAQAPA